MPRTTDDYYRVDVADATGCVTCGAGRYWTVVSGEGPDTVAIGSSWAGDEGRELAGDVCDLMNMAYHAGRESAQSESENG